MTNFELIAKLINLMGEDKKQNDIIKTAVLSLVEAEKESAADPKPEPKKKVRKTKTAAAASKEEPKNKKPIDWGKAGACRRAGWTYQAIADELGCSYAAVYSHFNEEKRS